MSDFADMLRNIDRIIAERNQLDFINGILQRQREEEVLQKKQKLLEPVIEIIKATLESVRVNRTRDGQYVNDPRSSWNIILRWDFKKEYGSFEIDYYQKNTPLFGKPKYHSERKTISYPFHRWKQIAVKWDEAFGTVTVQCDKSANKFTVTPSTLEAFRTEFEQALLEYFIKVHGRDWYDGGDWDEQLAKARENVSNPYAHEAISQWHLDEFERNERQGKTYLGNGKWMDTY